MLHLETTHRVNGNAESDCGGSEEGEDGLGLHCEKTGGLAELNRCR